MAYTFNGGIHIDEHKTTSGCVVEKMPPTKYVSIPMSQHIGAHAIPCVKVGDTVLRGQVIGTVDDKALGTDIHASVSGRVVEIIENNSMRGIKIRGVVIENDGRYTPHPSIRPWAKRLSETSTDEIISVIRKAGITGMGGATFPTYAKISSALGKIEHVIINCAECEPYITANHRLLLENPDSVINGLKILLKAFGLRKGLIAVEDNKLDAVDAIEEHLGESKLIEVKVLKTKYPQGDERQLIYALTGRELPTGKLPADVGCCIFNAETCAAVYNTFATGMPLVERILTVDGDCIAHPKNILAPLGTLYTDIIDYCGGLVRTPKKIISGGPMMGITQWDSANAAVTKSTSAILFFSENVENKYGQPPACIRCGRCVKGCPMHLMPSYLATFAKQNKLDMAEQFDVMSCVECGSCSYSCPGHVPIVQYIRAAKTQIDYRKRAEARALEQSKLEKPTATEPEKPKN